MPRLLRHLVATVPKEAYVTHTPTLHEETDNAADNLLREGATAFFLNREQNRPQNTKLQHLQPLVLGNSQRGKLIAMPQDVQLTIAMSLLTWSSTLDCPDGNCGHIPLVQIANVPVRAERHAMLNVSCWSFRMHLNHRFP